MSKIVLHYTPYPSNKGNNDKDKASTNPRF